jgi:hypothetical protein
MNSEDYLIFDEAISLVEASRTGKTTLGVAVCTTLRSHLDGDFMEFTDLPTGTGGKSKSHEEFGFEVTGTILVNEKYRNDLPTLALILAHEGVHRTLKLHSMDEELQCRAFHLDLYVEMRKGILFSSVRDGAMLIQVHDDPDPMWCHNELLYREHKQEIDFLLMGDDYDRLLSPDWVYRHRNDWGGIKNRFAATKGKYLRVLDDDARYAELILDILENVNSETWPRVVEQGAKINRMRDALHYFIVSSSYRTRVEKVQQELKIDLGLK